MRIFICADMEGTAGILTWSETERDNPDYPEYRDLMTREVVAACEGARAAGAAEVVVKDAHDSARNLIVGLLPSYVRVIRGWSGHPDSMMFGLDASFAGALYTGYHSKAGTEGNLLAHSFNTRISRLLLNGEVVSELTLNALCAARHGVPSLFLSGDEGICGDARALVPGIATVETLRGVGASSNSLSPEAARDAIRAGVEAAIRAPRPPLPEIPARLEMVIEFNTPNSAYRAAFYPGAKAHGPRAVSFVTDDLFQMQTARQFLLG